MGVCMVLKYLLGHRHAWCFDPCMCVCVLWRLYLLRVASSVWGACGSLNFACCGTLSPCTLVLVFRFQSCFQGYLCVMPVNHIVPQRVLFFFYYYFFSWMWLISVVKLNISSWLSRCYWLDRVSHAGTLYTLYTKHVFCLSHLSFIQGVSHTCTGWRFPNRYFMVVAGGVSMHSSSSLRTLTSQRNVSPRRPRV